MSFPPMEIYNMWGVRTPNARKGVSKVYGDSFCRSFTYSSMVPSYAFI